MLFFTRAFICIGAVVVLAEGFGPADAVRHASDAARTLTPGAALAPAAALCRAHPEACVSIAAAALHMLPGEDGTPPPPLPPVPPRPAPGRRGATSLPELSSRALVPR